MVALALFAVVAFALVAPVRAAEGASLTALREQAVREAIDSVAPSVVRIETIGGLEKVGDVLFSAGPTTGLVISPDGFIISSAFNFAQNPSSVLVTLPDGSRTPARLVATDHSRMLALLKVEVEEPLPVATAAPDEALRVGRWAIALGRTFSADAPNIALGIVSALGRVSGKAIQTDAKISPANYGGPLVDIEGRVLGVLVPLSPNESGAVAGVEWYDSGIGFAIPLSHVLSVLPRLSEGQDLHPGLLGVTLRGDDEDPERPIIAECRVNSPAAAGGLQPGDRFVELDGQPLASVRDLKNELNRRYAGDTVKVVVLRGEERLERELELVARIDPYERPFLGLLPLRGPAAGTAGVPVRYVYPDSGAAEAGLKPGDVIASLDAAPVADAAALRAAVTQLKPRTKVKLGVRRGAEQLDLDVQTTPQPETIPDELPPSSTDGRVAVAERPADGLASLTVPGYSGESLVYLPANYDPAVAPGLLVWLRAGGNVPDEAVLAAWQALCDRHDLVLVAPMPQDQGRWRPDDTEFLTKAIAAARDAYGVDETRVAIGGEGFGGTAAAAVGFAARDLVRAMVVVNAPLAGKIGDNDPLHPLAIYLAAPPSAPFAGPLKGLVAKLREQRYPVVEQPLGEMAQELSADEQAALARWLDTLDRI